MRVKDHLQERENDHFYRDSERFEAQNFSVSIAAEHIEKWIIQLVLLGLFY